MSIQKHQQCLAQATMPWQTEQPSVGYLLLEPDLIDGDLDTLLNDISDSIVYHYLWEDSPYYKAKTDGPRLIELQSTPQLIPHYTEHWAPKGIGLILHSHAPLTDILQHLCSILQVKLSNNTPAAFRLAETHKLHGVLNAFSPARQQQLLGPLQSLHWLECCGSKQQWYQWLNLDTNEAEATIKYSYTAPQDNWRWFTISAEELQKMDAADLDYFIRELADTLEQQHKITPELAQQYAEYSTHQGLKLGLDEEQDIQQLADMNVILAELPDREYQKLEKAFAEQTTLAQKRAFISGDYKHHLNEYLAARY